MREVKVEFRCQGCGHLFVDEEREFCEAPPVGTSLATQKVRALHNAAQSGEYLSPTERIAAESVLKAMRAGTPLEEAKPVVAAMSEEERNRLTTELRTAYRHHLLAFNAKQRTDHQGTIDEYVEKGIKQFEEEWVKVSRA